jgi:hypothetical protein
MNGEETTDCPNEVAFPKEANQVQLAKIENQSHSLSDPDHTAKLSFHKRGSNGPEGECLSLLGSLAEPEAAVFMLLIHWELQ